MAKYKFEFEWQRIVAFAETQCYFAPSRLIRLAPYQVKWLQKSFPNELSPEPPHRIVGPRRITRMLLSVPKKNGKTDLGAIIFLYFMVGPGCGQGLELFAAAGSQDQAGITYRRMEGMVRRNSHMEDRLEVIPSKMRIFAPMKHNVFAALPANAATQQGIRSTIFLYDELGEAPDMRLYELLDKGQGTDAEEDGFGMIFGTNHDSATNPLRELIESVESAQRAGKFEHWAIDVYRGDPKLTGKEGEFEWPNVERANPGLGYILSADTVRKQTAEVRMMPSRRPSFRAFRLNNDPGARDDRLLEPAVWTAAGDKLRPREEIFAEMRGELCLAGLDLSKRTDLSSCALYFPHRKFVMAVNWLPEDRVYERTDEDRVPYSMWVEEGRLLTTPGDIIDHQTIADFLDMLTRQFDLLEVRYDRWRMAPLMKEMEDRGVRVPWREFGQGFKTYGPAIEEFERLLLAGELRHDSDPVSTMCVLNCAIITDRNSTDAEARKPVKPSKSQRIDAAVAILMACANFGEDRTPPTVDSYVFDYAKYEARKKKEMETGKDGKN